VEQDLLKFVTASAARWMRLAQSVANGSKTFQQLEKIVQLQPNAQMLSRAHLSGHIFQKVEPFYQDFREVKVVYQLVGPFVAALRFFNMRQRDPIDELHQFIEQHIVSNWETTVMTRGKANIETINELLGWDTRAKECIRSMEFIGSLVTDEEHSPLIDWLKGKTDQDMEGIGKILQGALLEAYGTFPL